MIEINLDITNEEFNYAYDLVTNTDKLIYLTGKAGTGKTTFLKYLKSTTTKNIVVLAYTGVAAINAEGQTINSFFQIDFSPYIPNDERLRTSAKPGETTIYSHFKYREEKIEIFRALELLVIDEISMVRCDLLDVIDRILRVFRKNIKPFGGVQVLLIGDHFQLPPVVNQNEREILREFYNNPFFFGSKVFEKNKFIPIELIKNYRQNEQEFIDLLSRIRTNEVTQDDINLLNTRHNPTFVQDINGKYITIATHHWIIRPINISKLKELPTEEIVFVGNTTGTFLFKEREGESEEERLKREEREFPTDRILKLKEGSQIMFVKNDSGENRRYFNGNIGKIIKIENNEDTEIIVELPNGKQISVEKSTWKKIKYVWNKERQRIEEEEIGTFTQYPIKLAWAITVHKSQGLTFDKVIAVLNNALGAGQVYVALSRCTTFGGLVLKEEIPQGAIVVSPKVLEFENYIRTILKPSDEELNSWKADYYYRQTRKDLSKGYFDSAYDNLLKAICYRDDTKTEIFRRFFNIYSKQLFSFKKRYNDIQKIIVENKENKIKIQELKKENSKLSWELSEERGFDISYAF